MKAWGSASAGRARNAQAVLCSPACAAITVQSCTPTCCPAKPAAPAQTVAFCGVFPELKRAWASVDNSLFLWRFDKWWAGLAGLPSHGPPCFC